jgi:hypothetical protein
MCAWRQVRLLRDARPEFLYILSDERALNFGGHQLTGRHLPNCLLTDGDIFLLVLRKLSIANVIDIAVFALARVTL